MSGPHTEGYDSPSIETTAERRAEFLAGVMRTMTPEGYARAVEIVADLETSTAAALAADDVMRAQYAIHIRHTWIELAALLRAFGIR